jgi:hypothetical protein
MRTGRHGVMRAQAPHVFMISKWDNRTKCLEGKEHRAVQNPHVSRMIKYLK